MLDTLGSTAPEPVVFADVDLAPEEAAVASPPSPCPTGALGTVGLWCARAVRFAAAGSRLETLGQCGGFKGVDQKNAATNPRVYAAAGG